MKTYPLLQSQLEIFWAWSACPQTTAYNLPAAMRCPLTVDADRLATAVKDIVASRNVLHTRFFMTNGEPRQATDNSISIPVVRKRLSETEAEHYINKDFVRPFTFLGSEPLCRFEIITTESHHYLLADFHHTIADGLTIAQLFIAHDLRQAYQGAALTPDTMPPLLFLQAEKERASFNTATYQQSATISRKRFQNISFTTLATPTSQPWGDTVVAKTRINKDEVDCWCQQQGVSPNQLFTGAFALVLSRLSRQSQVAFFSLTHGRSSHNLRQAYGMFVQSLPLRAEPVGQQAVIDYIRQLRHELTTAMRNACYPSTHLCRDLHLEPTVTFAFQGEGIREKTMLSEDQPIEGVQLAHGTTRNDLACIVYAAQAYYEIRVESSEQLNSQTTVSLFAKAIDTCLHHLMALPEHPVDDIAIISKAEQERLITLGAGKETTYDEQKTVGDLITEQARRTPDAIAIVDHSGTMTYGKLIDTSSMVAKRIRKVESASFACLFTERQKDFLVGVLACWQAGRGYVPLDTENPRHRNQDILTDSQCRLLLTTHAAYDSMEPFYGVEEVVFLDDIAFTTLPTHPQPSLRLSSPTLPAYMIYTSGTTGQPKGVVITHRALAHFVHVITDLWHINADSRISCHVSLAFDASVEDLFPVLCVGGSLYIVPHDVRHDLNKMEAYLLSHAITGGCYSTQFGVLLSRNRRLPMHYLCLGGERLSHHPSTNIPHVYNTYGPTECTVDATYYEMPTQPHEGEIPIGRPLPGMKAYIVDACGHLLPRGAIGELWLSGPQLSTGYWRQPELTMEKFTVCRFISETVYHTGDLAYWNDEGQLVFAGRTDMQLKLRGYRIEPEEIEQAMLTLDGMTQAVVVAHHDEGEMQLHAYYTAIKTIAHSVIRKHLQTRLPHYMVPQRYLQLQQIPVRSNGKRDISQLPVIPEPPSGESLQPANEQERMLCEAYSAALDKGSVSPTDDFFALGGTSLTVMFLLGEAEKRGIRLHYGDVFQAPTPRELLKKVGEAWTQETEPIKQTMEKKGLETGKEIISEESPRHSCILDATRNTLLTGATGYLGIHILRELIRNGDRKVYCLVREKDGMKPRKRLQQRLIHYFGNDFSELYNKNIIVVEGDIAHACCLDSLRNKDIKDVVHCAANVKYYAPGTSLDDCNVDGTQQVTNFCIENGAKLFHVSTASTALLHTGNPYILSKQKAEKIVTETIERQQLHAQILSMGNVAPRRGDGLFQINPHDNVFFGLFRACGLLGCYPTEARTITVDLSPVDEAARFMVGLMQHRMIKERKIAVVGHQLPLGRMFDAMNNVGIQVSPVEGRTFQESAKAAMNNEKKAMWMAPIAICEEWMRNCLNVKGACRNMNERAAYMPSRPHYTSSINKWAAITDDYLCLMLRRLRRDGFFEG